MTEMKIWLTVGGGEVAVRVSMSLNVKHDKTVIPFMGYLGFDFKTERIMAGFHMFHDWAKPFGLKGVVLHQFELNFAANIGSPVPTEIDLGGGLTIGNFNGDAAVGMDLESSDFSHDFFGGHLNHMNLATAIKELTLQTLPNSFVDTAFDMVFGEVSVSFVPGTSSKSYNGLIYPSGFHLKVSEFKLYNLVSGSAALDFSPTGFSLKAAIKPFHFKNIFGAPLLEVGGIGNNKSLTANIQLLEKKPFVFEIDASIQVWKFAGIAANINITNSHWYISFDASLLDAVFDFHFVFESHGLQWMPSTFSLKATASLAFGHWLSNKGFAYMKSLFTSFKKRMSKAQDKVDKWLGPGGGNEFLKIAQNDIKRLSNEMDVVDGALKGESARLARDWQWLRVKNRAEMEHLSDMIRFERGNFQQCWGIFDFECHTHNMEVDLRIVALEGEKEAVHVTLSAAEEVVHSAKEGVDKAKEGVDYAKGRLDSAGGMRHGVFASAERHICHISAAALSTTERVLTSTLEAMKTVVNEIGKMVAEAAKFLENAINLQEVSFMGDLSVVHHSGMVGCNIKGSFFGTHFDRTWQIEFGNSDAVLELVHKMVRNKANGVTAADEGKPEKVEEHCETFTNCEACSAAKNKTGPACGWCQLTPNKGRCLTAKLPHGICPDWRLDTCVSDSFSTLGPCVASGSCVQTSRYGTGQQGYSSNEACTIIPKQSGILDVISFDTEQGYDALAVTNYLGVMNNATATGLEWLNGSMNASNRLNASNLLFSVPKSVYSGGLAAFPRLWVGASTMLSWKSDASVERLGWKFCLVGRDNLTSVSLPTSNAADSSNGTRRSAIAAHAHPAAPTPMPVRNDYHKAPHNGTPLVPANRRPGLLFTRRQHQSTGLDNRRSGT